MPLYKVFKLIDGDIVFGEVETYIDENKIANILIKKPFTARPAGLLPYTADVMSSAPAAVCIHPMNILWSVPLSEYPQVEQKYLDAISIIEKPESLIQTI